MSKRAWMAYLVVYLIFSLINWSLWIGNWGWFGRVVIVLMIVVHFLANSLKNKTERS